MRSPSQLASAGLSERRPAGVRRRVAGRASLHSDPQRGLHPQLEPGVRGDRRGRTVRPHRAGARSRWTPGCIRRGPRARHSATTFGRSTGWIESHSNGSDRGPETQNLKLISGRHAGSSGARAEGAAVAAASRVRLRPVSGCGKDRTNASTFEPSARSIGSLDRCSSWACARPSPRTYACRSSVRVLQSVSGVSPLSAELAAARQAARRTFAGPPWAAAGRSRILRSGVGSAFRVRPQAGRTSASASTPRSCSF